MIVDQAEKLRLMVRSTEQTAKVLAVTSGKGGVGKSNVAANLAICLAAAGKDVILLDADLGLANLDVILNVKLRHNLAEVIGGRRQLDEIVQTGPGGIRLIGGASGLTQMADLSRFQQRQIVEQMSSLEGQADVIVIDTGAGISDDVVCFCESSHHTIVVTTPEPPSITDAYAMIKALAANHTGVKISVLVNMVESRAEAKKVYERLAGVAKRFLSLVVYDAGYVLRDEHVVQAVRQREPVVLCHPRCQASYCFMALASKIGRAGRGSIRQDGFFRKVVNWFF